MYLVTIDPDTDEAISREVDDAGVSRMISYFLSSQHNRDGRAILIRRADYLDTSLPEETLTPTPRTLRLIQGGRAPDLYTLHVQIHPRTGGTTTSYSYGGSSYRSRSGRVVYSSGSSYARTSSVSFSRSSFGRSR